MKKIFFIMLTMFCSLHFWAEELEINRNVLYSTQNWFHSDVNFFNGRNLLRYNTYDFILNKEKTISLKIEYEPANEYPYFNRYYYNDLGQVISAETNFHGDYDKRNYQYDEKNRLVSYNEYHRLAYPDDCTCQDYGSGKLEYTFRYGWDNNVFILDAKGNAVESKRRFIIKDGKVVTVHDTTYYPKAPSEHYYDYEYDGDLLVKIVNRYFEDDIRHILRIEYGTDDDVSKITMESYRDGKIESVTSYYYSDYDSYGNWTTCKEYEDDRKLVNSIKRTIIYQGAPADAAFHYYVNDTRVRLREEPNLSGKIITVLDKGDLLDVVYKIKPKNGEKYGWYEVITKDGLLGWMYGEYVSER